MLTGLAALEATQWNGLHHAYGRAVDTPKHLLALLEEDDAGRKAATSHLWSAILHQGTPWTATAPVALVIAGLLSDKRIDRGGSLQADLLTFLAEVAAVAASGWTMEELERQADFDLEPLISSDDDAAIYEDDEAANAMYARAILGCMRAVPVLMESTLQSLDNPSPRVRSCAAMGVVALVKADALAFRRNEAETRLLGLARAASNVDERGAHVLALGDLGFTPAEFLQDESAAVRMCAALAPSLATNDVAIQELLTLLEDDPSHIDRLFVERPPQFSMDPRVSVVARLVAQVKDFQRLEKAAIAILRITSLYCCDWDWGPLLAAAFPDGSGKITTDAQRRFLTQLVARKDLWDPKFGNAMRWFKQAGLPYDRAACVKRLK